MSKPTDKMKLVIVIDGDSAEELFAVGPIGRHPQGDNQMSDEVLDTLLMDYEIEVSSIEDKQKRGVITLDEFRTRLAELQETFKKSILALINQALTAYKKELLCKANRRGFWFNEKDQMTEGLPQAAYMYSILKADREAAVREAEARGRLSVINNVKEWSDRVENSYNEMLGEEVRTIRSLQSQPTNTEKQE